MARRAKVKELEEGETFLVATAVHFRGAKHQRHFHLQGEGWGLTDQAPKGAKALAYFHFAPGLKPEIQGDQLKVMGLTFEFSGAESLVLREVTHSEGFNHPCPAMALEVAFQGKVQLILTP